MDECLFCRITAGEFKTEFAWADKDFVAFHDINPQAPLHLLVIPRQHVASLTEVGDERLLGGLLQAARLAAAKLEIHDYRLVINTGVEAGQSVFHLHLHLLSGRPMNWPPG